MKISSFLYALILSSIIVILAGCATHTSYDTGEFRKKNMEVEYNKITLNKEGLSGEQIKTITSTQPPKNFPVDISIILLKNGYINPAVENIFMSSMIAELKRSNKINRITVIPQFITPNQLSFSSIQELGVRSMSEYVIVLYIDGSTIFNWTKILETQFEMRSAADFIIVDSLTSAMMTSDKLYSKQIFETKIFGYQEEEKAQQELFSEQGKILAQKLDKLFSGSGN